MVLALRCCCYQWLVYIDTLVTSLVFFLTGRCVWSLEVQLQAESVVCSWTGLLCSDPVGHQN